MAREAFLGGHDSFQVHAFPFRMTDENMARYASHEAYPFWKTLKEGYDYFELTRQVPTVAVCNRRYVVNVACAAATPTRLDPEGACPAFLKPKPDPFRPQARRADRRAAHHRAGTEDARPGEHRGRHAALGPDVDRHASASPRPAPCRAWASRPAGERRVRSRADAPGERWSCAGCGWASRCSRPSPAPSSPHATGSSTGTHRRSKPSARAGWRWQRAGTPLAGTPDLATFAGRLAAQGLSLGAPVFIRIFKREFELELWMKREDRFHRFATYPICRWSGTLGPKLRRATARRPRASTRSMPRR